MNVVVKNVPPLIRRRVHTKTHSVKVIVDVTKQRVKTLNEIQTPRPPTRPVVVATFKKRQILPVRKPSSQQVRKPNSQGLRHQFRQQLHKQKSVKYITADVSPDAIHRIGKLRGIGRGKFLVIVGNGPSITEAPLDLLRGYSKIDIMSINRPDPRVWPTTYWTFFDHVQFKRNEHLWNSYGGIIFNGTAIKKQNANSIQIKNLGGNGVYSRDMTKGLHIGRSSVFAAMQIGQWMDYDKIFVFGCLPDGEKILTGRGMIPIESLADDDLVYSSSGFLPYTGYQRRWYTGTLTSILTRLNNIPLRLTAEHPVLVRREQHDVFVKADDLVVGDTAVFPIDNQVVDQPLDEDFWWLVGVYAAEGYIRKQNKHYRYAVLCLGAHEEEFRNEVRDIANRVLNCKVTGDTRNRATTELVVNNDAFGKFVEEHIGRGSTTKFISSMIMQLPLNKQISFIKGYCAGDGSLFNRKKRKHCGECMFSTASESLAEGLQKMLLRHGVISALVRANRPSGFDRTNSGSFGIRHHIHVKGAPLSILARSCGWSISTSGKQPLFGATIENGKLLVQISSLTRLAFSGYVNNIEVEGPHTFASRFLMTHNCDMNPDGLNGKLHFYGVNEDVKEEVRRKRFKQEAEHYLKAAHVMSGAERERFIFCTTYNPHEFIQRFNQLDHKVAVNEILRLAAV